MVMRDIKDFVIEDGVLKKYCGNSEKVIIPDGIICIGEGAFACNKTLSSVVIPDDVQCIEPHAFWACHNLVEVMIGNGVTRIEALAFEVCRSLEKVSLGNAVTYIGRNAFGECKKLTGIVMPAAVTCIEEGAFEECESLSNITVDGDNQVYSSLDGNLYDKNQTTLLRYAIGKTESSFAIPYSVTSVGSAAFSHCKSLTHIDVPYNCIGIED